MPSFTPNVIVMYIHLIIHIFFQIYECIPFPIEGEKQWQRARCYPFHRLLAFSNGEKIVKLVLGTNDFSDKILSENIAFMKMQNQFIL